MKVKEAVLGKLYQFLTPAVTNCHKLSGKQHKFIILQFWGDKSKMGFTGLRLRCRQHWFFLEAPRKGFIQGINFQFVEAT